MWKIKVACFFLGHSVLYRRAAARHLSAFRNGTVTSDFSFPATHGLEIVTTGLIVCQ